MAFHVACPITCRRICFCTLGFPEKLQREQSRNEFLEEVFRVEELLSDPLLLGDGGKGTVQVLVPRISPAVATAAATVEIKLDGAACGDGEEILSARTKRVAMQRKAVAASLAAEDYARRFENGDFADASGEVIRDIAGEAQGSSTVKVVCRICYYGENEGSSKAMKMLSCKICSKKYHRNCLKSWAEYRDLFHWSSWVCPSCRICEVCRRAGDPNKFMFCKRCDGAYHCYCQQPPHKNVTAGPYLCPKHTRCHSCASTVSGSGLSTRWFLGYTFCDACGRLFVKGNYCPVCLKVYRDSESTPMVCCDECQRWVHCGCDGISDEKYQQFQVDKNLYYKCAACRSDCYQIRDLDDAVQELWRRRDKADRDQIASLRAAAGLPSQEEIFSISPYSDDEENSPVILKNEYGRSLKFSLKGLAEKPMKNSKEYGKKSSKTNKKHIKKKGYQAPPIGKTEEAHQSFEGLHETRSLESSLGDGKTDDRRSYRDEGPDIFSQLITRSPDNNKDKSSLNQPVITNHSYIELVGKDKSSRVVPIKSSKSHGLDHGEGGTMRHASKAETVKGTKLVIHLAARNRNITNSPKSEGSSCHREQDLLASNGSEDNEQQKANDKENCMLDKHDGMGRYNDGKGVRLDSVKLLKVSKHKGKESSSIKLGKVKPEVSEPNPKGGRENTTEECESTALVILGKRSRKGSTTASEPEITFKHDEVPLRKHSKGNTINLRNESRDSTLSPSVPDSVLKDPKPLLKLKFKNPYLENRSSWIPQGEEEKSSVKGQRSKRKRPSPLMEKAPVREDENDSHVQQENPLDEVMDASWILKKLGKDAIGKRVEVHQSSNNSWHKGVVTDSIEGASAVAVLLDDGRDKTVELGKQAVRFISQKQKRTRT